VRAALAAVHVENGYAVLAGRQIIQDKHRAIFGLARRPENPAQKFSARQRFRAIGVSKKGGRTVACAPVNAAWFSLTAASMPAKLAATLGMEFCFRAAYIAARRHLEIALAAASSAVRVAASMSAALWQTCAWQTTMPAAAATATAA
jgi:hypothetical protein